MLIARTLILIVLALVPDDVAIGEAASLLTNGSFETGHDPGISSQLDRVSPALPGWSITEGNIDYIGKRWPAYEGKRCVELNGTASGSISQTIDRLVVGRRYQLSFKMAVNPEAPPAMTRLLVAVGGVSNRFSMVEPGTTSRLEWRPHYLEFTANAASVILVVTSINQRWAGPVLDDFQLIPVVIPLSKERSDVVGDLSRDFSTNSNPNGPWRYGWKTRLDGPLMLLTTSKWSTEGGGTSVFSWRFSDLEWPGVFVVTEQAKLPTAEDQLLCPLGGVYLAPGMTDAPEDYGAARFVVPNGNPRKYRIEAEVGGVFGGRMQGDADFHVLTNNTEVFGLLLAPSVSATYTNEMILSGGDTLDFVVGRGWDRKHQKSLLRVFTRIATLND